MKNVQEKNQDARGDTPKVNTDDSRTASADTVLSASVSPDHVTNEPDDDYPYDDEEPYCHRCDNKGFILVCVDDMCRGAGECMHGDGEIVCPDCKGESAW